MLVQLEMGRVVENSRAVTQPPQIYVKKNSEKNGCYSERPYRVKTMCRTVLRSPKRSNHGLYTDAPVVRDGLLHLNDLPGFGVDIDWDFVKQHQA
jgi:hypothetical protein